MTQRSLTQLVQSKTCSGIVLSLAVAGLFFSYRPTFSFGYYANTNLELSVTLLTLGLMIIAALPLLQRALRVNTWHPVLFLASLYPFISTIGVIWSANKVRGLLLASIAWFIFAVLCALIAHKKAIMAHRALLIRVGLYTTLVACAFAWFQIFAEAAGVDPAITLLPGPYLADVFGFARPTAFALEPQYLGSLLIAPILLGVYYEEQKKSTVLLRTTFFVSIVTLFATISRGALIACAIGVLIILITAAARKVSLHRAPLVIGCFAAGLVIAGLLVFVAAFIRTPSVPEAQNAIIRSVNHLSIGTVALPLRDVSTPAIPVDTNAEAARKESASNPIIETGTYVRPPEESGYVVESTDSRVSMTGAAAELWLQSPSTFLFGVGTGGFGAALNMAHPEYPDSTIVNNQFAGTLAELGLIGILAFASFFVYCGITFIRKKEYLALALTITYLVQWYFFLGSTNVLHTWFIISILLVYTLSKKAHASMIHPTAHI